MNIISKLFGCNDIGIDLGSANMRVWVKGRGLVLDEPSVVRYHHDRETAKSHIVGVGDEAFGAIILEFPWRYDIAFRRPMKGGAIPELGIVEKFLAYCFERAKAVCKIKFRKSRVTIAVPCGITEYEKCILKGAAQSAGASEVFFIDSLKAVAIGAGIPVSEPKGCMIVDIGAAMTKIAALSHGDVVHGKVLHVGGDDMDKSIMKLMLNKHNLCMCGERQAANIKVKIGTACDPETELDCEVQGRDFESGLARTITVNSQEIREEALADVLGQIEEALGGFLAHLEPGLLTDIAANGIFLTGGGALLRGLDKRLAEATGLPVRVADDPAHATIRGIGAVVGEPDFRSKIGNCDGAGSINRASGKWVMNRNRAKGMLWGLIVGDAFGSPIQFRGKDNHPCVCSVRC